MKYYNNQIKSIERNMGIEYNKDNKENTQINYLNIKKINLPLNHIKISFDLFKNNNNLKNKRNYNNMTYLNLSKEKQIISTFNSKSKRNKINIKSSPQIFHQYSNNDFSKLQIDKDRLQKISKSINLPSVSMMVKNKKININTNYLDKILSNIPKKSLMILDKLKY